MGCKDDDTCDQPVTKGDLENMKPLISNAYLLILLSITVTGIYFDSKNQRRVLSLNQAKLRHEVKYPDDPAYTRTRIIGDSILYPDDGSGFTLRKD